VRSLLRAVEAVLRRWDPIDVLPGDVAPADEYDSYAPGVVSMLAGGCSVAELAIHLERIRTETMGLGADRRRDTAFAEELVASWRAREEAGPPQA
jgi:hypothetical protein